MYQDQSVKVLLSDLANGISKLVRQELRLAQAEGSEKISQLTTGFISILGGLLVALVALLVLVQALVIGLSNFMPPSLASLSVGVVLAVVAFVLIKAGQNSLKPVKLAPERTMRSVREDKDMVMEKVR